VSAPEDATRPEVTRAVEALLFLSPEPLPLERLCELTEEAPGPVQRALAALGARHDRDRALEVAEVGGGWVLRTRPDLAVVADRLRGRPPEERLSPAALETLAVVAYLEPVTRREIARLRGVAPDSALGSLLERGLVEAVAPAARAPGAASRYRTTPEFLRRFGLPDRAALPPIERFELTGPEAEGIRARLASMGRTPDQNDQADGGEG
jgi:segregation and condensation protein B